MPSCIEQRRCDNDHELADLWLPALTQVTLLSSHFCGESKCGNYHVVKWTNKVKVHCLMGPCVGSLNGGMQAWVGRARTADARFLRSIIDRCVSLLDSIAAPFWLSSHSRSWFLYFYALKLTSLPYTSHPSHTPLGLTTTAHPGFSRLVPPSIRSSPASAKSSGRGFHKPLPPRLS